MHSSIVLRAFPFVPIILAFCLITAFLDLPTMSSMSIVRFAMNDLLRQLIQDVVDSTCSNGVVETAYVDLLADYLTVNPPGPKDPIVVVLSEGQIESVQIPYEGYTVEVRDYDAVAEYLNYAVDEESQPLEDWTEVDEDGDRYAPRMFSA